MIPVLNLIAGLQNARATNEQEQALPFTIQLFWNLLMLNNKCMKTALNSFSILALGVVVMLCLYHRAVAFKPPAAFRTASVATQGGGLKRSYDIINDKSMIAQLPQLLYNYRSIRTISSMFIPNMAPRFLRYATRSIGSSAVGKHGAKSGIDSRAVTVEDTPVRTRRMDGSGESVVVSPTNAKVKLFKVRPVLNFS